MKDADTGAPDPTLPYRDTFDIKCTERPPTDARKTSWQ